MDADFEYIVRQPVGPGAKLLWLALRNRGAGEHSQPQLSKYIGRSLPSIADDLNQLKVNGLLEARSQGAGRANLYKATIRKGNA